MSAARKDLKIVAAALGLSAAMGAACCVVIALAAATLGLREDSQVGAIERVLREDDGTFTGSATTTVAAMRAIDLEGCPDDFKRAYERHIAAWELSARVETVSLKSVGAENPDYDARRSRAQREIQSTFEDVQRVAESYGARLP